MHRLILKTNKLWLSSLLILVLLLMMGCGGSGGEGGTQTTHTITASSGPNGTITPSGAASVLEGDDQTFTITPDTGFEILDILVDGVSQGAIGSYTFSNVTADHTISASFDVATYTITPSAGTNGSISPSGTVSVLYGGSQAFTITADTGFEISDVLVDGVSQGAIGSYTFNNVTADHTISASFVVITYTISASAGLNGSISPSGAVSVDHGASQSFTITADSGYDISDVVADGASQGAISSYTFNNVTTDHTISATFTETMLPGKAVLGPLSGAIIEVFATTDLTTAVYTTTAVSSSDLATAGTFEIPESSLDDSTTYLVKVTGGEDIDVDDDGVVDGPTPNSGTLRLLARGVDLKQDTFTVNILTELAYSEAAYQVITGGDLEIIFGILNRTADMLLSEGVGDLDSDGDIDYMDLAQFDPVTDQSVLRQGWAALAPYTMAVLSGSSYANENGVRLSGIVGNLTSTDNEARNVVLSDDGTTLYMANDDFGLQVINITDPFAPFEVANVTSVSDTKDVVLSDDNIFVAGGINGLYILDITNLSLPPQIVVLPGVANGVAVSPDGSTAYVVNSGTVAENTLNVVDVATLGVTSISLSGRGRDVVVEGDYAYIASRAGMEIINILTMTHLTRVDWTHLGHGTTSAHGIAVNNGYAYVADENSGIVIIDVSTPEFPGSPVALPLPGAGRGIFVIDNWAYVACDYTGIQVIDVFDPSAPVSVGFFDTPYSAYGVSVFGDLAYVADMLSGLQIIDVSVPVKNGAVGFTRVSTEAYSVSLSGNHAFVGEIGNLLASIDISDTMSPVFLQAIGSGDRGSAVAISGNNAFSVNFNAPGLNAFEISSPGSMSVLGSFIIPDPDIDVVTDVATSGNIAYLAEQRGAVPGSAGISVVNISDANNISFVTSLDSPGFTYGLAVSGDYLYAAEGRLGLYVYDISNPTAPSFVNSADLVAGVGAAHGIAVAGNYAFLSVFHSGMDDNGVEVFDISDPANPQWVNVVNIGGLAERIAISGNYAYVSAHLGGVYVVDISDPTMPVVAGHIDTPDEANDVAVENGYVFVADRVGGLQVFNACD